jgi:hypothetical protein
MPSMPSFESLSTNTGRLRARESHGLSFTFFQRRLGAVMTVPVRTSTTPGVPTPMPAIWLILRLAPSTTVRTASMMRSSTSSVPRWALVPTFRSWRSSRSDVNTPAMIFDPPTSTPTM